MSEKEESTFSGMMIGVIVGIILTVFVVLEAMGCNAQIACHRQGFSSGHFEAKYGYVCEAWQPMPTPIVSDK